MNPAHAWVATRMRKRGSSVNAAAINTRSLRFTSANSAFFTRTPSSADSAGNRTKIAYSTWIKKTVNASASAYQTLFATYFNGSSGSTFQITFQNDDTLRVLEFSSYPTVATQLITTQVYRDTAAWMHIAFIQDTNLANPADRAQLWVNGSRVTSFSTNTVPSQGYSSCVGTTNAMSVGCMIYPSAQFFNDGYMAESYCVIGQDVTAASFGQTDATTGQWIPKQYSGAFGTNGFYLPFKSNAAINGSGTASGAYPNVTGVSGLGADFSGNNAHFTGSGILLTDQCTDVPANNYCTLNPLLSNVTLGMANLTNTSSPGWFSGVGSTIGVNSGKWYVETRLANYGGGSYAGLGFYSTAAGARGGSKVAEVLYNSGVNTTYEYAAFSWSMTSGRVGYNGTQLETPSLPSSGDYVIFALDLDNRKGYVGRASSAASSVTWLTGCGAPGSGAGYSLTNIQSLLGDVAFGIAPNSTSSTVTYETNFGQNVFNWGSGKTDASGLGNFRFTVPSGYKGLCTANLPTPAILKPSQYFATFLYTGNGGTQTIGDSIAPASGSAIARSLRFQSANSNSLSRVPPQTNQQTWTFSTWVKRSALGINGYILDSVFDGNNRFYLTFLSNETLNVVQIGGGSTVLNLVTTSLYSDMSQWHHLLVSCDMNNATAANRLKIYWDGQQVTSFSTNTIPASGTNLSINAPNIHSIGRYSAGAGGYFEGYLAETHFIDATVLTPSSFGQTDSASGLWVPKSFANSYGGNSFSLNYADNSNTTATTLGKDSSANGNNWTPNNFAVTDSVTDTPTTRFPTWDQMSKMESSAAITTFFGANLTVKVPASSLYASYILGTQPLPVSGKWYWEITGDNVQNGYSTGITLLQSPTYANWLSLSYTYEHQGSQNMRGSSLAFANSWASGDIVGVAYDADNLKLWYSKNGVWQAGGAPASGTNAATTVVPGTYAPSLYMCSSNGVGQNTATVNFGQGGQSGLTYDSASGGTFKYTPPGGFKALNIGNIPAVSSSALTTTPDLVWIKGRSGATDHALYDTVRGATLDLATNINTGTGENAQFGGVMTFNKTGFTVGGLAKVNTAGSTYAAWAWKKGATPGFDIVTYSGDGSSSRAISHTLGAIPQTIIVMQRGPNTDHQVYHSAVGKSAALFIDITGGQNTVYSTTYWGNTTPTASSFYVGSPSYANNSGAPYVAYLWAEVPGFSKMGFYVGNGSTDGPFVWCGFKPAWIAWKRYNSTGSWRIMDCRRPGFNSGNFSLFAESPSAEETSTTMADILSNGFKVRNSGAGDNGSGDAHLFIAFAESPFKASNAR